MGDMPVLVPFFLPPPAYVARLGDAGEAHPDMTLRELCARAQTPCRASGAWALRKVRLTSRGKPGSSRVEPLNGPVEIVVPDGLDDRDAARYALCVLAYSVLDGVARASVARQPWARLGAG